MAADEQQLEAQSSRSTQPRRIAIACQGGGSHTAFTAGVLDRLCVAINGDRYQLLGLSGTSGGAVCALLAWYAIKQGRMSDAGRLLAEFWDDNSATSPWEQMANAAMMLAGDLQDYMTMPAVSPYSNPLADYGAQEFKQMLARRVDFEQLQADPDGVALVIGAVDVLSGEFRAFDSRRDRISADMVLASAAIPTLFQAVKLDGGSYWDGLFSQNPPIRELIDLAPDEIWVIQINPTETPREPRSVIEISDRRNELSGNLSLHQELHFIEKIDRWLESGVLSADSRYRRIVVRVIELSPERVDIPLSASSKLNRDPAFIGALMDHGRVQADEFLTALAFEQAWRSEDADAVIGFLSPQLEFKSSTPFRDAEGGIEVASDFIRTNLGRTAIDLTRKQLVADRVTWTVKAANGKEPANGRVEITLVDAKVTSLRLGPAPK